MSDKSVVDVLRSLNENLANGIKKLEGNNEKPQLTRTASLSRSDKVPIYVRVVFLKIGDIDTIKEQFTADVFVQSKWREPALDGQGKSEEKECPSPAQTWKPHLHIDNAIGDLKTDKWYMVGYNEAGEATMYERQRVKGCFFEKMELNEYPFDNQDLTLTMSTLRGETELSLEADQSEISTVNIQSFLDSQEWHLHKHINSWTRVTTNVYHNTKHKHPAVSISCKASRKSNFFMWNIILIMALIGSMAFTTFAVDVDLVQNRIQLTFILILSTVTFKFIVANSVPKISYLTWVVLICSLAFAPFAVNLEKVENRLQLTFILVLSNLTFKFTASRSLPVLSYLTMMIFIGCLAFTTWAVDVDKVQNRLQLTFILLLSNITFKFTVSHTIPKVSYLTVMDKYIISSMAILCIVCVWHAVVAQIFDRYGEETAETADWIGLVVLGCIYLGLNVGFLMYTQCVVRSRHIQYSRKDLEQKEKMRVMSEQKQEEMMSSKRGQIAPMMGVW